MECPYTGRKIVSPLDFDVKENEDEKHLKIENPASKMQGLRGREDSPFNMTE